MGDHYRQVLLYCSVYVLSTCNAIHIPIHSLAEPPKITTHPKDIVPGKPLSFTVQATGAEPMSYQWQWKPIGKDGSEEWQNLTSDGSVVGTDTLTLTFSGSESCSEGLYRCVVTNCTGTAPSKWAEHIIGE